MIFAGVRRAQTAVMDIIPYTGAFFKGFGRNNMQIFVSLSFPSKTEGVGDAARRP